MVMNFNEMLRVVGREPVFHSGLLLAGHTDPPEMQKQLSRWTHSGRILQLRRGLYTLAPPYDKVTPHPFLVANRMVPHSYLSLQSALAYYGMIPEFVVEVTSVTTGRPNTLENPLGRFSFRHIKNEAFTGFVYREVAKGQFVFIANPAKALLDLVYFSRFEQAGDFLEGLRLQNLAHIRTEELLNLAPVFNSKKINEAVQAILALAEAQKDFELL